jgi:hypothetical protein
MMVFEGYYIIDDGNVLTISDEKRFIILGTNFDIMEFPGVYEDLLQDYTQFNGKCLFVFSEGMFVTEDDISSYIDYIEGDGFNEIHLN